MRVSIRSFGGVAGAFLLDERELIKNPGLGLIWEAGALAEIAAPGLAGEDDFIFEWEKGIAIWHRFSGGEGTAAV